MIINFLGDLIDYDTAEIYRFYIFKFLELYEVTVFSMVAISLFLFIHGKDYDESLVRRG